MPHPTTPRYRLQSHLATTLHTNVKLEAKEEDEDEEDDDNDDADEEEGDDTQSTADSGMAQAVDPTTPAPDNVIALPNGTVFPGERFHIAYGNGPPPPPQPKWKLTTEPSPMIELDEWKPRAAELLGGPSTTKSDTLGNAPAVANTDEPDDLSNELAKVRKRRQRAEEKEKAKAMATAPKRTLQPWVQPPPHLRESPAGSSGDGFAKRARASEKGESVIQGDLVHNFGFPDRTFGGKVPSPFKDTRKQTELGWRNKLRTIGNVENEDGVPKARHIDQTRMIDTWISKLFSKIVNFNT